MNIVLVHGAWAVGSSWSGVIEVPSSHVAMVSHPDETARLITSAAQA